MNFEIDPSENFKFVNEELFNIPPPIVETQNLGNVFWTKNPNILFDPNHIWELFPSDNLPLGPRLNALTRLIVLFTLVGYLATRRITVAIGGILAILLVVVFYYILPREDVNDEPFDNPANSEIPPNINESVVFENPTLRNPFSNVMLTDYTDNPDKKPAPPLLQDERDVHRIKETINSMNPSNPNISDRLFKGVGDELDLEQSLRQFTSNPSTTIPNDQKAFSEFCYGDMVSGHESNAFALARNLPRYTNY